MRWGGYALAMFVGVTVTVGFYEGRRLAKDTSRSFAIASKQLNARNARSARKVNRNRDKNGERDEDEAAVAEGEGGEEGEVREKKARDPSKMLVDRLERRMGGDRRRAQKFANKIRSMKPEQIKQYRERRKDRRKRWRDRQKGRDGEAGELPLEDEEFYEDDPLMDDEFIEDTGLLPIDEG